MTASESIYNPNKRGNAQGKTRHLAQYYDANGLYFQYGNGCDKGGKSCLECVLPECQWNSEKLYKRGELSKNLKETP